jgi:hypothetical protein
MGSISCQALLLADTLLEISLDMEYLKNMVVTTKQFSVKLFQSKDHALLRTRNICKRRKGS